MTTQQLQLATGRGSFAVRRTGTGARTVLCLHPLALSGAFWDPLAQHFGQTDTVLAPDLRAHGGSGWDGAPFTVEDMADDVAAVLRACTAGPVGVIGLSMGGCVAIELAARHPALVDGLVLADTTSCYGPDRVEKWEARAQNAQGKPRAAQLDFQLGRWFSERFRAEQPDQAQRVVDIFLATDSAAHAAACRALGAFDGTDELARIACPTLVMVGEHDQATPPAMATVLAEQIPHARLELLHEAHHFSLLERPDVWPLLAGHLGCQAGAR